MGIASLNTAFVADFAFLCLIFSIGYVANFHITPHLRVLPEECTLIPSTTGVASYVFEYLFRVALGPSDGWLEHHTRSTFPSLLAGIITVAFPGIVVVFCRSQTNSLLPGVVPVPRKESLLRTLIFFAYTVAIMTAFTSLGKVTFGRYRPDFMRRCPEWTTHTEPWSDVSLCFPTSLSEWMCCLKGEYSLLREGQLSFPSGHSGIGLAAITFCILIILYGREKRQMHHYILSAVMGVAGIAVAISRVIDHRHHLSDVMVGATIGISLAVSMFYAFYSCQMRTLGTMAVMRILPLLTLGARDSTE